MDGSAPPLKHYAELVGLRVGVAVQASYLSGRYEKLINAEFDTVVAENEMKMDFVYRPSTSAGEGEFDWRLADSIVNKAKAAGMSVRGHTLLWHNAVPEVIRSWDMSRDQWRSWMATYISTVVQRYRGVVEEWDVVNEGFVHPDIDNEHGVEGHRDSFWRKVLGPEYVEYCFRLAHQADSTAKLYYNDHSIEWENPKSDIVYRQLKRMKEQGVPIHGIGFQCHISHCSGDVEDFRSNFARFVAIGLEVSLTEVDVFPIPAHHEGYLVKQAQIYGALVRMAVEMRFKNFVVWGLHDDASWVNYFQHLLPGKSKPLLFDAEFRPKPAYYEVHRVLCEKARSQVGGSSRARQPRIFVD